MLIRFFNNRLFYFLALLSKVITTLPRHRERGRNHLFFQFSAIWPSPRVSTSAEEWPLTQTTVSPHMTRHVRPHLRYSKARRHNLRLQTAPDSPKLSDPRSVLPFDGNRRPFEVWKVTQDQCTVCPHSLGRVGTHF